jgi:phosphopentomutase
MVPLLGYGGRLKKDVYVGIRETFADLGQTIADIFGVPPLENGTSFKNLIWE